jgi:hypothetical protein
VVGVAAECQRVVWPEAPRHTFESVVQAFPDAARALGDVGLVGPWSCTCRYSSALLPNNFERPGPKSVSAATNCSGVDVVVWLK